VAGDETVDGEIGNDVTIVNEDRVVPDPVGDVFDAASGLQKDGFVEEGEFGSAVGEIWEGCVPGFVKVMGVDGEVGDASRHAVVQHVGDERPIGEGNEGLRQGFGEWLESAPEACSQKKCFPHGEILGFFCFLWKTHCICSV